MLFQSQPFILLFMPLCLLAYYAAGRRTILRQWVLALASLAFYAWWDIRFLPLLIGQVAVTWGLARLSGEARRRWPLVLGIVLNLLAIGSFKYLDFMVDSLNASLGFALPRSGLILPIGISFFSFELISYLIDYGRRQAPRYPFRSLLLFVVFFPHLIAGPIVRHNEIIPQFDDDPLREGMARRFGLGFLIFTIGFAKKVLLADAIAPKVDELFTAAATRALNFGEAWSVGLGFTAQLILDFSAYTEMAIGLGLMLGLILPENFNRPYLATSLQDFWRRWHMTLSRFIRDYLYIPMGGSRNGHLLYIWAALGSMAVCGLWHGAGWTFVVWGLMHGAGLVVCRFWSLWGKPLPPVLGWLLTFLFVVAGWVLFRAPDFATAAAIFKSMAGFNGVRGKFIAPGLIFAGLAVSVIIPMTSELRDRWLRPHPVLALITAALFIVCLLEVGKGAALSFIYFQF